MSPLKVGVIGVPGKWSTEVLADELERLTGFRQVIDLADLAVHSDGRCMVGGHDLRQLDGLVVKKVTAEYSALTLDLIEVLKHIQNQGVRLFSPASEIGRLINRASCTNALLQAGVPMPATCITASLKQAITAVSEFGDAVLKPLYSTKGRGMVLLESASSASSIEGALRAFQKDNPLMYIQEKVQMDGQDLGLVFLGGQYQGAYARVGAQGAWQTTIHSGGRYAAAQPDQEVIDIASQAQAAFNLDFTTVDVVITDRGPMVFEVSAFGGFKGAKEGAGLDAAALYANYVVSRLQSGLSRPHS